MGMHEAKFNPTANFEKRWLAESYIEKHGGKILNTRKWKGRYKLGDKVYFVQYDARLFAWFILDETHEWKSRKDQGLDREMD
jgi:hypothetical protein